MLNPALSEKQVNQFESQAGIILPSGYKDFLLHIGNGAAGTKPFPLSLTNANDCLESCMPGETDYNYRSLPFSLDNCNKCFDNTLDAIDDDVTDEEYERLVLKALQGTVTLYHDGCGYYKVLIVSGEHAGKIFYIDTCSGQGAYEISPSFEEHYLEWLDRKIVEQSAYLEQNDKFECSITNIKLGGNVRDLEVIHAHTDYRFQFEFFCPNDFAREGGYSELTQINDNLIISLYMKHVNYSPLAVEKIEGTKQSNSNEPVKLIGERSEHVVIGQVTRLFQFNNGEKNFPLYVEALQQEILIREAPVAAVSVGDVFRITGRLCGTVYSITR
ncbi:SMI1/KNR4 family protein [Paenibacillus sp. FJAT-26967]|uniref:SMI1/KNR4 family protein n=1 Tax=Paenibacillus sp. FJAT-26967 TaxID=1729690 RepID=UPI000ADF3D25|nr:SMI1/KNR4 family protein [Paenibacillus sp. FJAT-26967]